MALRLEQKQIIVAEVNEVAVKALSAVLADYRGMTVTQLTSMRKRARESGVYIRVIRNTLARRALQGTEYECLQEAFTGPTLLAFSKEDPGAAARLLKDCAKEYDKLQIKALSIGGKLLAASDIDRLAKLPTKEQALAMLLAVLQAPIAKLARTMNEVPSKLVRTIAAIRDQKEAAV